MNNLNKITHTRVGDNIHYFQNGQEARGVIVKMSNAYVSVLKDSGVIDEIHINDTFFVKDIITNKTWNEMNLEERVVELQKAHAFSPRFISKTWEDLPQELRDVLLKTNLEETTLGQLGGNRAGVSTDTDVKAPEDYKGESDEDKKEEFKHEEKKPSVDKKKAPINKNNAMEESSKKVDDMQQDWRPTGAKEKKADKEVKLTEGGKKVLDEAKRYASLDMYKSMPLWKTWLEKDVRTGKQSKDGKPASNPTYLESGKIESGSELGGKGRAYSGGATSTSVLSPKDLKYRTHDGRQGSLDFESPDHDENCPRCRQDREDTLRRLREREGDKKIPKGGKSPLVKVTVSPALIVTSLGSKIRLPPAPICISAA